MSRSIIDTGAIQAASADINRLSADIRGSIGAMRSRLGALSGAWEGPARQQFDETVRRYHDLQNRMNEMLDEIGVVTARAGAAYEQHEQQTRSLFIA